MRSVPAVTAACLLEGGDGCDGRVLAAVVGCPGFWDMTAIQIFSVPGFMLPGFYFQQMQWGKVHERMVGIVMNIKG